MFVEEDHLPLPAGRRARTRSNGSEPWSGSRSRSSRRRAASRRCAARRISSVRLGRKTSKSSARTARRRVNREWFRHRSVHRGGRAFGQVFGGRREERDADGERAARHAHDRRAEEPRDRLGVERGGHHEDQVLARSAAPRAQQGGRDVGVEAGWNSSRMTAPVPSRNGSSSIWRVRMPSVSTHGASAGRRALEPDVVSPPRGRVPSRSPPRTTSADFASATCRAGASRCSGCRLRTAPGAPARSAARVVLFAGDEHRAATLAHGGDDLREVGIDRQRGAAVHGGRLQSGGSMGKRPDLAQLFACQTSPEWTSRHAEASRRRRGRACRCRRGRGFAVGRSSAACGRRPSSSPTCTARMSNVSSNTSGLLGQRGGRPPPVWTKKYDLCLVDVDAGCPRKAQCSSGTSA